MCLAGFNAFDMTSRKVVSGFQGVDPKLDLGEGASDSFYCLFHVKRFSTLVLAIGILPFGGHSPPGPSWIRPHTKTLGP